MRYVGRVPAPPPDRFIDDIYCLTGVPRHRRMSVPPMPSAHLFISLGGPVRLRDSDPSVPPAVFTDAWSQGSLQTVVELIPGQLELERLDDVDGIEVAAADSEALGHVVTVVGKFKPFHRDGRAVVVVHPCHPAIGDLGGRVLRSLVTDVGGYRVGTVTS